jgi:hypothetical protein
VSKASLWGYLSLSFSLGRAFQFGWSEEGGAGGPDRSFDGFLEMAARAFAPQEQADRAVRFVNQMNMAIPITP